MSCAMQAASALCESEILKLNVNEQSLKSVVYDDHDFKISGLSIFNGRHQKAPA